jgi:hypothetical protein
MSLRRIVRRAGLPHSLMNGATNMMVEQNILEQQVARALQQADAIGDCLIAALLSQCLELIHSREPARD